MIFSLSIIFFFQLFEYLVLFQIIIVYFLRRFFFFKKFHQMKLKIINHLNFYNIEIRSNECLIRTCTYATLSLTSKGNARYVVPVTTFVSTAKQPIIQILIIIAKFYIFWIWMRQAMKSKKSKMDQLSFLIVPLLPWHLEEQIHLAKSSYDALNATQHFIFAY